MPAFDKRMASDRKGLARLLTRCSSCVRCTVKCTSWISGTFRVKDARGRTKGTIGAMPGQYSELAVSGHDENRFEMAAYLSLSLPSQSVALVRHTSGRSTRLPTSCDACQKMINNYPYIAKHSTNGHHRKYHVACALRIGLVLRAPTLGTDGIRPRTRSAGVRGNAPPGWSPP